MNSILRAKLSVRSGVTPRPFGRSCRPRHHPILLPGKPHCTDDCRSGIRSFPRPPSNMLRSFQKLATIFSLYVHRPSHSQSWEIWPLAKTGHLGRLASIAALTLLVLLHRSLPRSDPSIYPSMFRVSTPCDKAECASKSHSKDFNGGAHEGKSLLLHRARASRPDSLEGSS